MDSSTTFLLRWSSAAPGQSILKDTVHQQQIASQATNSEAFESVVISHSTTKGFCNEQNDQTKKPHLSQFVRNAFGVELLWYGIGLLLSLAAALKESVTYT